MKLRLGIIGVLDTVDVIENIAKEFEDQIQVEVFSYQNKDEVINLIEKSKDLVDVFLFSGQLPYAVSEKDKSLNKPNIYIPRTGESLYRAFWQMKEKNMDYGKISFDTIPKKPIEEVAKNLNITIDSLYVKTYSKDIEYLELVDFHYDLWKNGKINVAITCLTTTFIELKNLGVPVIKLYPTDSLIRECIQEAIYLGDARKIKETQIAVQIVRIKSKSTCLEYELLKLKNKLEGILINYTQDCLGYMFPFGGDEYLIFSTRGAIKDQWEQFQLYERLGKEGYRKDIKIASGIGFGNTVYESETNARIALGYAIEESYNCCFIIDENSQITGPIGGNEEHLTYNLSLVDKKMQLIAKEIQVSPAYLSKIKAIIQRSGTNKMDSQTFANHLEISERSGRRILKRITDEGYAKIVATQSSSGKGRPRLVYEILL